jgi:hypothetical protein
MARISVSSLFRRVETLFFRLLNPIVRSGAPLLESFPCPRIKRFPREMKKTNPLSAPDDVNREPSQIGAALPELGQPLSPQ